MPSERISMSKLKQLIELQSSNLSVRALARVLDLSRRTDRPRQPRTGAHAGSSAQARGTNRNLRQHAGKRLILAA